MVGPHKIIALCTCRIQDDESHNFIELLNKQLLTIGCRLFIYNTCWTTPEGMEDKDPQLVIFDLIDASFVDAIIIQADRFGNSEVCRRIVKKALKMNLPVISLGNEFDGCLNIRYNHQKGFRDIINHLINVHHITDFHMIAGFKDNKYSEERIEVFKNVLEIHNIPFSNDMISYGDFWPLPAKNIVLDLIKQNKLPKAFVCANDNMAIAVAETLIQNGFRVPQDIAVTGYDCIDSIYSSEPSITSAYISEIYSAKAIFDAVCEVLSGSRTEGIISLSSQMIINESCGCSGTERKNLTPYLNEHNSIFCIFQDENILLAEVGAKIQLCNSFDEITEVMKNSGIMDSMCCVLKREVVDDSKDPSISYSKDFGNDMFLLYDSDLIKNGGFFPYMVKGSSRVPNFDYYINEGKCLIFTVIHNMDIPLGFTCFHFDEYSVGNFLRLPQITNTLNNALGGYRNLRHSKYLTNKIEKLYQLDALTGLYNRRGFMIEFEKLMTKINGKDITAIMCDLDDLKILNDTYGHEEGDLALQNVAKSLKIACGNNAIITRYGGDEMLAVIAEVINEDQIRYMFNDYLEKYNKRSGKPYIVSASLGISCMKAGKKLKFEDIIKVTDDLMYTEKKLKKDLINA